jgi:predicted nucleic acid-binding protein
MTPEPPAGVRCFIDANILVYHFVANPPFTAASRAFMQRVQAREIVGCISPVVASEALHRIMLSEVQAQFQAAKPLPYVQRRPQIIGTLRTYHAAAAALATMELDMLQMDAGTFGRTATMAGRYGLLTGDASHVALMEREGISYLISNDDDFDAVAGITVCKPR